MENISHQFSDWYEPQRALLFYKCTRGQGENSMYVESYDIGQKGTPVNAHPLSVKEMIALAEILQSANELKSDYLRSDGLMPQQVLHIDPQGAGRVIWHTPPQQVYLYFSAQLGIPCGWARVPAMVWKAGKEQLSVFAVKGNKKPVTTTPLYHAPFFNIHSGGNVCMGTVAIHTGQSMCLEHFISRWEQYFWNSYFSHLLEDISPVSENIVQLWKKQVETQQDFPVNVLRKNNRTLQNLIG